MVQDPNKPKDNGKIGLPPVDTAMNKLPPRKKSGGKGVKEDGTFGNSDDPDQKILLTARKRFDRCVQAEGDNRKKALEDTKFLNGDQWPADVAAQRNTDKRPCLTFNKLKTFVHQVTNPQRENRPAINISPVGDKVDVKAAKMFGGVIRHIERDSRADIAYDTAFWQAASCGFGYWRVDTEYESPDSFDQKIVIRRIRNQFTVYMDPDAQIPTGQDAKFGFVTEMMPSDVYKEMYPESEMVGFNPSGAGDTYKEWVSKDSVRLAEYYTIEHTMRDLVQLDNGHKGWKDELADDILEQIASGTIKITAERESEEKKCMWYKINALEILERTEIKTEGMIPIVRVIGDEIDEQGKVTYSGIVRDAKDPQRMYNYWRTTEAEIVALQPKAPYIMEEGQAEGHESEWKQANTKAFPVLYYKGTTIGGKPAPPPQRQSMVQAPAGVLQAIQGAAQDMQAVTGIRFDATIAERVHDESGKALHELRRSGDIGSLHYEDNLARALDYTGLLIIRMFPNYYDTPRVLTILREDGKAQTVKVDPNAPKALSMGKDAAGKALPIFNPTIGKYGVTATAGPSYATKRIEAADQMMKFVAAMPSVGEKVADLIAKNQDWPDADQFASRLAKALPPNLLVPDMTDMDPQVQAFIQSMQMQLKQAAMEKMQMVKQLQDQTADRLLMQDKTDKDFQAKVMAVIQKMEAAGQKADTSFTDTVLRTADMLHGQHMDLTNQATQNQQFDATRADQQNQPKPQ
jgi:hypothetical protein